MKKELHELDKVVWGVIPRVQYRGCYVEKLPSGYYSLWGHTGLTAEGVDRLIDESLMAVSKSIKNEG